MDWRDFFEDAKIPAIAGIIGGVIGTIIARLLLHL